MAKRAVEQLLGFALGNDLIGRQDVPYCRNLLLDLLNLDEPETGFDTYGPKEDQPQRTALPYLKALCDHAAGNGILSPDTPAMRELFSARLMGAITLPPSAIQGRFEALCRKESVKAATDWFYEYCKKCNYIQVDAIEKNVAFKAGSPAGELDITINLSKPEKDPRDIAAALAVSKSGYPACLLCVENTGHAGSLTQPARQNHRMLPLRLDGQDWHLQYSPYLYYSEHCIALNDRHVPMAISRGTFTRLLDFVDQFPHYFIGSNADLPIVGGSILTHDHFQGGAYTFAMDRAKDRLALSQSAFPGVRASLADWPMTCIRLRGADRGELTGLANRVLEAWRAYSDPDAGILSESEGTPHNTITPIARKTRDGYLLQLVLRNNRTDATHPLGIFHPHEDLHHIKKENIGLIEVMGLFILPGRLKEELEGVRKALAGESTPNECAPIHIPWVKEILESHGQMSGQEAQSVLEAELAKKCARVLADAGVYKQTDAGIKAFLRFWDASI